MTRSFSAIYDTQQIANFETWAVALKSTLIALGFVQTSDSRQIDPSNPPTTTGSGAVTLSGDDVSFGYLMFRMGDSLQSTAPFFIRIDFASAHANFSDSTITGSGSATGLGAIPEIQIRIGTGSDGGGNLTGNVSPLMKVHGSWYPGNGSTSQQSVFAGNGGAWLSAVMWDGSSFQDPWFLVIERTKDSTGADNADGLIVHILSSGGGVYSFVLPSGSNVPLAPNNTVSIPLNYKQVSMAGSGVLGVAFPTPYNGRPYNFGIGCCFFQGADFGPQSENAISIYGASHTYRVPTVVSSESWSENAAAQARVMLRYE